MKCPKCGFEQPVALECVRCGIVFSKFAKSQQQTLEALAEMSSDLDETRPLDIDETPATFQQDPIVSPATQQPVAGTPGAESDQASSLSARSTRPIARPQQAAEVNPLDLPIRPLLRWIRLLAGLFAIAFGSLLFWAGEGVAPDPAEALFLIVYLCVGAFWVLSFNFKTTTVRRFSFEMVLFIVVTLGIRLTSPNLFDTEKITQGLSMPAPGEATSSRQGEKTSAAQLKQAAWELNRTTRMLVAGELKTDENWTGMIKDLKKAYRGLPAAERDRLEDSYRAAIDLEKAVETWRADPTSDNADRIYDLIETIDTFDW
jgi:hypothetical protein